MAEPYFEQLAELMRQFESTGSSDESLETRHFFSGAALYADQNICGVLGPDGLALKLPEHNRQKLIKETKGAPFRFFLNGPIKRQYLLLSISTLQDEQTLQELIRLSISFVTQDNSVYDAEGKGR